MYIRFTSMKTKTKSQDVAKIQSTVQIRLSPKDPGRPRGYSVSAKICDYIR